MYFHDAEGQLQSILASCADAGGVDPFVEISAGRSFFRYEDLVRLVDLLEGLRRGTPREAVKKITPHT